jgi:hypothetical protein
MTRIGQVEWPCLAGQRRHAKLSNRRAQLAKLFLLRLPPPLCLSIPTSTRTSATSAYRAINSVLAAAAAAAAAAATGLGASSNIITFTTSTSRQVVLGALLGPATLELHIIPNRAQSRLRHVLRELDDVPAGLSVPSLSPPPPSHPTSLATRISFGNPFPAFLQHAEVSKIVLTRRIQSR